MPSLDDMGHRTLTVDALVDLQSLQDVRIAKSGSQVAYSLNDRTKKLDRELTSYIWVADVGKEKSSRQLTSGLFNDKSPEWSPDGETIAFISDRAKAGESSAIYLMSVKGGEAYPITKADNKKPISSFSWSPNGKFIAFTSADEKSEAREARDRSKDDAKVYGIEWEYNRLRCVHVATKEISNLFALDSHVDKFTWCQSSAEIIFTLHRTPDLNSPFYHGIEFRAISLSKKESTLLSLFPGPVDKLVDSEGIVYFIGGTDPKSACTSSMLYQLVVSRERETKVTKIAYGENDCALELRLSGGYVALRVQKGLSDEIHRIEQTSFIRPDVSAFSTLHEAKCELSTWDLAEVEGWDDETHKSILCFGKSEGGQPKSFPK